VSILRRCLVAVSVLLTVVAAVRVAAILGRLPWWLHDPLVYFPTLFYVMPGVVLVVILWRLQVARPVFLRTLLAILGINFAADLRPPTRQPADRPDEAVRLLTFNVYQTRLADEDILTLVRDRRPDILFLQEAPLPFVRAHEAELRQMFRHVEAHDQLLVATNLGLLEVERIQLSYAREVLHLALDVRGTRLDVFNTHLSVANPRRYFTRLREQERQTDELLGHMGRAPGPVISSGDFNFPLHSTNYKRVTASYASARTDVGTGFGYTFHAFLPVTAIDHCFGRGVRFVRWQPVPVHLSDHRPVEVEFVLPPVTP
jgi:endonuclease/exonuclease/phosphatase (EEP) superfamily protein YafD